VRELEAMSDERRKRLREKRRRNFFGWRESLCECENMQVVVMCLYIGEASGL